MKIEREAIYADEIKWKKVGDKVWEKILWEDEKTGTYVRLVRVDPAFKAEKPLRHEWDELVYVLQGQQVNTKTGKIWHQGTFSFFPAGADHGPFATNEGILSIEFRYFSSGKKTSEQ